MGDCFSVVLVGGRTGAIGRSEGERCAGFVRPEGDDREKVEAAGFANADE